ncbi:MAG TPA: hypothetical protein VK395_26795, partial [Gemmataceae bacterium]|nr:hypothetical protein [Gemmataceae bacterium]
RAQRERAGLHRLALGGDELLSAVNVVGRTREGLIDHDMNCERGHVSPVIPHRRRKAAGKPNNRGCFLGSASGVRL